MQPWLRYAAFGLLAFVALIMVLGALSAIFPPPDEPQEQTALRLPTVASQPTATPAATPTPTIEQPTATPAPPSPTATPVPPPPPAVDLTRLIKSSFQEAADAKVKYTDDSVGILLVVYADPEAAQEIAGRAIRLVKERVEGGDIDGHSRWQYIVTAFRPKETEPFVVGVKRPMRGYIEWDPLGTGAGVPETNQKAMPTTAAPPPTALPLTATPTVERSIAEATPTVKEALRELIFCEKLALKEEVYWGISPSTLANLDPRFSGTLEPMDYIRILTPESNAGAIRVKVYPHDLRSVSSRSDDQVWIDWDILIMQPEHRFDQLVFSCED